MKNRLASRRKTRALTLIELLVVMAILFILAGLLLPALYRPERRSPRIYCASNLKQIGIAFVIWADDHGDTFPQALAGDTNYATLGSTKWPTTGSPDTPADSPYTYLVFAAMSNELNTPKVLICPADSRLSRANFGNDFVGSTGGHNLGVSYFAGRDATNSNPAAFLDGDRNICADTTTTTIANHGYGLSPDGSDRGAACAITTNYPSFTNIGWSPKMHQSSGNVGLADGSVQQFSQSGLLSGLRASAVGTTNIAAQNYLLFP